MSRIVRPVDLRAGFCCDRAFADSSRYQAVAEEGNARVQRMLGMMHEKGTSGVAQNFSEYDLGQMYDTGEVVPKDDEQASLLYIMAAEAGAVTTAGFELSRMYANGEGVPQDSVIACLVSGSSSAICLLLSRAYSPD